MTKQIVHFFELPELYKILLELKDILSFDINNYQSKKELSNAITENKLDFGNSIIVAKSGENLLINNRAIAVKRANTSIACPEFPNINCTNAKIIQTTNQIKINII